jgi:MFS family permease
VNDSARLYTPSFFLLFAVIFCFICGYSLQFHFGQYVEFLGGEEGVLGWVLGLGVIGSLCTRPIVGLLIDRFGPRPGLLVGALLSMGAALSYPWTRHLTVVCLLRVVSMMALALFMTAGAVLAAWIAPPRRRA